MSHSTFTASERRGILAVALVALLIIIAGLLIPLISNPRELPEIKMEEMTELVDSASMSGKELPVKRKSGKIEKKKKSKTANPKKTKTMRKRSPLDEPV